MTGLLSMEPSRFLLALLVCAGLVLITIKAIQSDSDSTSSGGGGGTLQPNQIASFNIVDQTDFSNSINVTENSYFSYLARHTLTWSTTQPGFQICSISNLHNDPGNNNEKRFLVTLNNETLNSSLNFSQNVYLVPGGNYQLQIKCSAEGVQTATYLGTVFNATCMLGFVSLLTSEGSKHASSVQVHDLMLQPDGSYSTVEEVQKSLISLDTKLPDRRLFSTQDKKVVVTYWHMVKLLDQWVLPETCMDEVTDQFPSENFVYHFKLTTASDVLMTENGLVIESLN